jgi:hypothetical protein
MGHRARPGSPVDVLAHVAIVSLGTAARESQLIEYMILHLAIRALCMLHAIGVRSDSISNYRSSRALHERV